MISPGPSRQLRFPDLDVVVDLEARTVRRDGRVFPCAPLTARILRFLASRSGRIVSRDELLREVWSDVVVGTSSVPQALRVLRRDLESAGVEAEVVRTVRGHGYQLVQTCVERSAELEHARALLAAADARGSTGVTPDPAWIRRVQDAVDANPEPSLERARLLSLLAEALWFTESFARARSLVDESVALAARLEDHDALCEALVRAKRIHQFGPGDEAIRAEIYAQLASAVPRVRDRRIAVEAYPFLLVEAAQHGRRDEVGRWATRAMAEAETLDDPRSRWWALVCEASVEQLGGRLARAEALVDPAFELGRSAGLAPAMPNYVLQMFSLRRDQGRLAEVEPLLAEGLQFNPENLAWRIGWHLTEAAAGRLGPAREVLRTYATGDLALPEHAARRDILFMLAEMAIDLEDPDLAGPAYEGLLPIADQHGFVMLGFMHWDSHHGRLGQLAALRGDDALAERHLREAIERDRRFGAFLSVARHQSALAPVLERQGRTDEARRARAEARTLRGDLGLAAAGPA